MGRRLNESKKGMLLSLFFLKYFLYLCLATAVICVTALCVLDWMFVSGFIYPADYAQQQANESREIIAKANVVSEEIIPDLCEYVVFDFEGNVLSGNMEQEKVKTAWNTVLGVAYYSPYDIYKVIERECEYCVLRYQIVPQYRSETLRKHLFSPQSLLIFTTLTAIVFSLILIAVRFGYVLKKKMNALILVTTKIQNQDLEFTAEQSSIKEINDVLNALDKMRAALKNALETQWKTQQIQKEQISALAHDLKTPLTVVRGNTELLYDTEPTEEQLELIEYISQSSLQMQDYIKMLIDIAKSSELYEMKLQNRRVADFAEGLKEQAKALCCAKNILLKWNCDVITECFCVDFELLFRAIGNVLTNASEHVAEDGVIEVEIRAEDDLAVFSVKDNGKGFSEEGLKYALTQFYMEDDSRHTTSHYGIGLYAADTIVRQHNGKLYVKNRTHHAGANIIIEIPLLKLVE